MTKKTIISILLVVIIASAFAYLVVFKEEASAPTTDSATTAATTTPKPTTSKPTSEASTGAYVTYSSSVIADTDGTKVLFFHAPWCPQCRAIEADIVPENIPANTTIIKVDYDSNQALRQKYGVTLQTTFVRVDDDGNLVAKYVAYDEPTFASVKENIL